MSRILDSETLAVTLRDVDRDNVRELCELTIHPAQERLVAPTAITIAESHYYPGALLRGIYAKGAPAGLIWVDFSEGYPYLVRLSVAAALQRQGIGARAMALLEDHLRADGHAELQLSFVPVEDGPKGFYERLGFSDTGRTIQGEVIWRKEL